MNVLNAWSIKDISSVFMSLGLVLLLWGLTSLWLFQSMIPLRARQDFPRNSKTANILASCELSGVSIAYPLLSPKL